jgi:hypothetical protein
MAATVRMILCFSPIRLVSRVIGLEYGPSRN